MAKKDAKTIPAAHGARMAGVPKQAGDSAQKTAARAGMVGSKPVSKRAATSTAKRSSPTANLARDIPEESVAEVLQELRGLKSAVEQLVARPTEADAGLDASVDSLRRLLSELIEQRLESVVRELADIRREAASMEANGGPRLVARLDELLESLGAVRFEADPMDIVDPLIHVVVAERQQANVPAGVVIETVRPGYRTSRGWIVCKAAVAVSQGY